jgi:predicted site-specific integrase-resolvase
MNDEYITSQKARQILQITTKTLRIWGEEGKIRTIRTPSNIRRYSSQDIQRIINGNITPNEKQKICYARVSSRKQMDDLERQKDFFRSNFPSHELVTDIGSGINWKRKGLQTILEGAMQGHISEIVVAHRDRLCRFAFELLEWIFKQNRVTLVVLNQTEEQSSDKELTDDILSIIHVYSCRQMGKRRYTNKENKIISELISKNSVEEMDGDKEICL